MYRIRLHGRGGQGVKTGSRILGSALFAAGFEVQDAPLYGAERRGAPVSAHVRAARAPIHERGLVTRPDLVVVGDETLIPLPAANVLAGISRGTVMVVRGTEPATLWQQRLKLDGPVLRLPTPQGDTATTSSDVGMACAGAAARLLGVVTRATLEQALRDELRGRDGATIEHALACAGEAFDALAAHAGVVREGVAISARDYARPQWIEPSLEDVRIAAPDIHAERTSELVHTGAWRTQRPVIEHDRCHRCSWICSTFCPDGAIDVDADHLPHVDYEHCKGCMICVAVCPRDAIHAVAEPRPEGAA